MNTPVCTEQITDDFLPWEEFLPEVLPYARELPDNIAVAEIRNAAIDFCQRTGVLRKSTWIDAWRGVENYPIDPPDKLNLLWLARVLVEGKERPLLSKHPASGYGFGAWFDADSRMLYLFPAPVQDRENGIEVEQVLAPSPLSEVAPRVLWERYVFAISRGALARVLLMPGTPWYNPDQAQLMHREYRTELGRAKVSIEKGHQSGIHCLQPAYRWY